MDSTTLLATAQQGFKTLQVGESHQKKALQLLEQWLQEEQFSDYRPQIEHLIQQGYWDYLLDSFYQIIPFGTAGRRGEVGVGPNRINPWTIASSAQGHSQFLLKQYGQAAKTRGVVLVYDVREFFSNKYFNQALPNPVANLTCKDLAIQSASVYTANGIQVYLFDGIRSTPELSFAVRHLGAVGGNVFSASHNPPEHNGQKVFDEFGGQLVPPLDEELVAQVTQNLGTIQQLPFEQAKQQGLVKIVGSEVDQAYIQAVKQSSLSDQTDISIVYTPLHGTGLTNAFAVLTSAGFAVQKDPKTSYPSGKFENITFNIPNPEVVQSFETSLQFAKQVQADILLSSDPDADRFGAMIKHHNDWVFLNGNEIGAVMAEFIIQKRKDTIKQGVMIKTTVSTNLVREVCRQNEVELIGELLVGYKYIGEEMNRLDREGRLDQFLFGFEESHGYNLGDYAREKDSAVAALIFAQLAAELKLQGKTVIDYLNELYAKYGYFRNYLTEIRLPGAEGRGQIDAIQQSLRTNPPQSFGSFIVESVDDFLDHLPIVSETDKVSKNMITFNLRPVDGTASIKITIRPSGTEPKSKMYFEIGSQPFATGHLESVKQQIEQIRQELEKAFMKECYRIIGIDFPDRGFLLFWQLPLNSKINYFKIEPQIAALKDQPDPQVRKQQLDQLLEFLGSNPLDKVDQAFKAEYNQSILEYLNLK